MGYDGWKVIGSITHTIMTKEASISNPSSPRTSTSNRAARITGILCAACCTVPLVAIAIGSATLAGLAVYLEETALVAAVMGLAFFLYKRVTRKTSPSCALDCACHHSTPGPTVSKSD